jgi:hypothetical protein
MLHGRTAVLSCNTDRTCLKVEVHPTAGHLTRTDHCFLDHFLTPTACKKLLVFSQLINGILGIIFFCLKLFLSYIDLKEGFIPHNKTKSKL